MTVFKPTANKDDGETHDTCPTCNGRVHTKATCDATGHDYRLECESCPWTVPLERPPTPTTRDDAVILADGGTTVDTTTDGGPQSAQEILDELYHVDSVARVADQIKTGDANPTGADIRKTLRLAGDRLCLTVDFRTGMEYIWLADGWAGLIAKKVRPNGDVLGPIVLSADDLERRLAKPIDVELADATPVDRPDNGGEH